MKFAKLFDVADTQVLVLLCNHEETDEMPLVKVSTFSEGMYITAGIAFNNLDVEEAWDKAEALLANYDQEAAEKFYKGMVTSVCGGTA